MNFSQLLKISVEAHGHLCAGQVLGVRMAMLGLDLLGYEAPLDDTNIKKVIIFIEIDRCAADAVASVTGVKLGRRSLKFMDYGLMAATFVNLPDNKAYRVSVREDCREKVSLFAPGIDEKEKAEIEAYKKMPVSDLFEALAVKTDIQPWDMPGASQYKVTCQKCGTVVRHKREIEVNGKTLCRVCAGGVYFEVIGSAQDLTSFKQ